jgi:hypothetical protein
LGWSVDRSDRPQRNECCQGMCGCRICRVVCSCSVGGRFTVLLEYWVALLDTSTHDGPAMMIDSPPYNIGALLLATGSSTGGSIRCLCSTGVL